MRICFFGTFTYLSTINADTTPPTTLSNPTKGETATNADVVFEGTPVTRGGGARGLHVGRKRPDCHRHDKIGRLILEFYRQATHNYRVVAQDGSGNSTGVVRRGLRALLWSEISFRSVGERQWDVVHEPRWNQYNRGRQVRHCGRTEQRFCLCELGLPAPMRHWRGQIVSPCGMACR